MSLISMSSVSDARRRAQARRDAHMKSLQRDVVNAAIGSDEEALSEARRLYFEGAQLTIEDWLKVSERLDERAVADAYEKAALYGDDDAIGPTEPPLPLPDDLVSQTEAARFANRTNTWVRACIMAGEIKDYGRSMRNGHTVRLVSLGEVKTLSQLWAQRPVKVTVAWRSLDVQKLLAGDRPATELAQMLGVSNETVRQRRRSYYWERERAREAVEQELRAEADRVGRCPRALALLEEWGRPFAQTGEVQQFTTTSTELDWEDWDMLGVWDEPGANEPAEPVEILIFTPDDNAADDG